MTSQAAYQQLFLQLSNLYDSNEAAGIANLVMEFVTGEQKIDRLLNGSSPITGEQQAQMHSLTEQLLQSIPVQYALNEAWFAGMRFYVNEHVLIPRPEKEELVDWVLKDIMQKKNSGNKLVDIGTGSGCIPVTIKKQLQGWDIDAVDVSPAALEVARKNAAQLDADINWIEMDFLNEDSWNSLPVYDVIVSNPPYVKQSESFTMARHVLDHEPHIALFVPDEDALLFYKKTASFAQSHLHKTGAVFLEINESLGAEVVSLFNSKGFVTELRKDMQGKDRMLKASFG